MAIAADGIVLIGGGGHALVVAEAALSAGMRLAGFLDDAHGAVLGVEGESGRVATQRLGAFVDLESALAGARWIMAIGDLAVRRQTLGRLGALPGAASVVHARAIVSASKGLAATVGPGAYVGPGAVVHARAAIGAHAIINSGAIVEHECQIGENAHIAPGAALGGRVRVGADTLVGLGARVLAGRVIGAGCVVGAGAVVLEDVPDGARVAGVPARSLGRGA